MGVGRKSEERRQKRTVNENISSSNHWQARGIRLGEFSNPILERIKIVIYKATLDAIVLDYNLHLPILSQQIKTNSCCNVERQKQNEKLSSKYHDANYVIKWFLILS